MPSKKKTTESDKIQAEVYPVVRNGKFVCSDGTEFSDGYFASEHQEKLNQQSNK